METEQPPCQDHRRHVEQFIGKRPPERTKGQLEHISRNRHGKGKPDALSCQNRGREYALEYFRHLVNVSEVASFGERHQIAFIEVHHRVRLQRLNPLINAASLWWTIPPLEYDISGADQSGLR